MAHLPASLYDFSHTEDHYAAGAAPASEGTIRLSHKALYAVSAAAEHAIPRAGMLAMVRNRRGVVAAVEPFDGDNGRLHLVHLEYQDAHGPAEERLLWELEPKRELLEPNALPDTRAAPMPPEDFDALLRAARWTALSPYLDPDGDGPLSRQPVASPFHGSVRVEDYQLVPLLKALRMPRVSLLIADDVGLGKTIEAGLILTELLLRRRIQRVLVLTPASLRQQWRDELWEKFSLRFEIVDRQSTERLRRRLGMDANPWRSFSRIVASYHYLRQPDVREGFLAACQTPEGSPHLPWDLLIVDECHNLMPSPFGEDSELCRTLRLVAPLFEHRLFLSATPHNGHTRSFTGLLEMLDPVRFSRVNEMNEAMRGRVEDVVVRRLKRDINAEATSRGENSGASNAPRFCVRQPPVGLTLPTDAREAELAAAFDTFRKAIRDLVAAGSKGRRRAGAFAVEILGKRLLSCPAAFAESWRRAREGFSETVASESALTAAERALRQETGDDRETQQREATAATVTGAWLKNFAQDVTGEIARIERALADLDFDLEGPPITEQTPIVDARFKMLTTLIERLLLDADHFRGNERLIVFTEYKTTLDYLARRLRERYPAERVLTLFGTGSGSLPGNYPSGSITEGMSEVDRENVKVAFNDPAAAVRILVATDAASEGLNLHRTARYLLHYDCPWNPSRLEQRNGRLDRYGQARDVTVHHFVSNSDPDLRFLDHVIRKANEIREDLGSVNEVFDRAVHRRLIRGEEADDSPNRPGCWHRRLTGNNGHRSRRSGRAGRGVPPRCTRTRRLGPGTRPGPGSARRHPGGRHGHFRRATTTPGHRGSGLPSGTASRPSGLAGRHRRRGTSANARRTESPGPMPKLAFGPEPFIERLGDLSVFLPRQDTLLVHLAHPMMQRALGVLNRRRYPGQYQVSRWTIRSGRRSGRNGRARLVQRRGTGRKRVARDVPSLDTHTGLPCPKRGTRPAAAARASATNCLAACRARPYPGTARQAGEIVDSREARPRALAARLQERNSIRSISDTSLDADERTARAPGGRAVPAAPGRGFRPHRTINACAADSRDRAAHRQTQRQGQLFDQEDRYAELEQSIEQKREEVERRRRHYEEIRDAVAARAHPHPGSTCYPPGSLSRVRLQVFPVTVEVRVPEGKPVRSASPDVRASPAGTGLRHGGLLLDGTRLADARALRTRNPSTSTRSVNSGSKRNAILDGSGDGAQIRRFRAWSGSAAWTALPEPGPGAATSRPSEGRRAVTGEIVKPRHLWKGPRGARLPVFLDQPTRAGCRSKSAAHEKKARHRP